MGENVVKLELVHVGEGFRFGADEILDAAMGELDECVIIGIRKEDGGLWVSGTGNAGVTMILMEKAKHKICELDE